MQRERERERERGVGRENCLSFYVKSKLKVREKFPLSVPYLRVERERESKKEWERERVRKSGRERELEK